MPRPLFAALAVVLLAACATSAPGPEPAAAPVHEDDSPAARIERAALARLAQEPADGLPAGLDVSVLSVEEGEAGLIYKAELLTAKNRRRQQDFILYGQCPPARIEACAEQIVSAARMLKD